MYRKPGIAWKDHFFGMLKRNGRVYTEIVSDCSKANLQGIIRGCVGLKSAIRLDGCPGYDGLVNLGYQKRFRVPHTQNEFANKHSHINGIENF